VVKSRYLAGWRLSQLRGQLMGQEGL
jgi:hypothetical protein